MMPLRVVARKEKPRERHSTREVNHCVDWLDYGLPREPDVTTVCVALLSATPAAEEAIAICCGEVPVSFKAACAKSSDGFLKLGSPANCVATSEIAVSTATLLPETVGARATADWKPKAAAWELLILPPCARYSDRPCAATGCNACATFWICFWVEGWVSQDQNWAKGFVVLEDVVVEAVEEPD